MLYSEIIAVCSQIHTQPHKYTVWAEHRIFSVVKRNCVSVNARRICLHERIVSFWNDVKLCVRDGKECWSVYMRPLI
jgi:hypothetical protein